MKSTINDLDTSVVNMLLPYVQIGGNNVLTSHVKTKRSNVSMPCNQDMDTSTTIPNIESIATPYGDNQPADPNLWDDSFSPTSIFGINESLDKDSINIALSL